MIMTIAAPSSCAWRLRSAQTRELKCVVGTMTRTRPATCASSVVVSTSRSSSDNTNCSEKFARMHKPSEPAPIMKSTQRRCPSRSSAPPSSKTVGTTGNTPVSRLRIAGFSLLLRARIFNTFRFGILLRLAGGRLGVLQKEHADARRRRFVNSVLHLAEFRERGSARIDEAQQIAVRKDPACDCAHQWKERRAGRVEFDPQPDRRARVLERGGADLVAFGIGELPRAEHV